MVYGLALAINVLPPDGRDLALRTAGLPLLPIDRELGEIVGPVGLGLPALDRPRGAAERDAVVVPAGGEQGCADIGAIDEMLPWCQVFRAQSLVDGVGTLGLIDCSGGRVHVREEVRHGRLTCLTDMHHIASPLRVAFLAIARLRIIGGLDPLRGRGQLVVALEADAGQRRVALRRPLAWGPIAVALPGLPESRYER